MRNIFKVKLKYPSKISLLVDERWYLQKYPDVANAGVSALDHFMTVGWAEGRNPCALFDTEWYLKQNPDVEVAGLNPLTHYTDFGWTEGRKPHPLFDPPYYLSCNPDVAAAGIDPLGHYATTGWREGRQPNPAFHPKWYLDTYPDVNAAGMEPLAHFIEAGCEEGRKPHPEFNIANYLRTPLGTPHTGYEIPVTPPSSQPPIQNTPQVAILRNNARDADYRRTCFLDVAEALNELEIVELIRQKLPKSAARPEVTVIIPVFKNLRYTLRCILSIAQSTDKTPYKVVVVDDQSPDGSGIWLQENLGDLPSIDVIINQENLGFLRSCNAAAKAVATPYLFLLNNDTYVLDGWLDELYAVLMRHPDCGLTGSKLLYPDGSLQEAGGIIWNDASGANFGRGQDAWKPEFNYQRDVDYISGASIMTPTHVWQELGGFSEEFAPAYYEDTDYALKVRQMGLRVIYQPLSSVIHFEGVSSGTDITQGTKRYQAINQGTFLKKWTKHLAGAGAPADFSRHIVDRAPRGRILIYDAETPRPDKDSGSVTAFQYMKILLELGMRVTFVPQNLLWGNKHSRALQRLGVEVIFAPYQTDARRFVLERAGEFDVIMLSRAPIGGRLINELRDRYPRIPIIFDTVDVHHLRMFRQYELEQSWPLWEEAAKMKEVELNAIRKSDVTLLVSNAEVQYLNDELGPFPHAVLPLIYEAYTPQNSFDQRKDVAFIGGFRHTPNVDAVEFLVNEIWPLVRKRKTGAKLHIIGSHMPKDFARYSCDDIIPVGYVEQLEPYMETIKLSLAPLRYGAGVKGKVGNSLRMGIPVVGTPIAVEGMNLEPDVHVKVGGTAQEFADAIVELYENEAKWTLMANAGRKHVMESFGTDAAKQTLSSVINSMMARR